MPSTQTTRLSGLRITPEPNTKKDRANLKMSVFTTEGRDAINPKDLFDGFFIFNTTLDIPQHWSEEDNQWLTI